jgi:hypothetical protein
VGEVNCDEALCMYFGYFVDLVMEKKIYPLERFHLV